MKYSSATYRHKFNEIATKVIKYPDFILSQSSLFTLFYPIVNYDIKTFYICRYLNIHSNEAIYLSTIITRIYKRSMG